jgi:hypothetical protein
MDRKIRWTVMMYIAADSSIANFAVESLKQINRTVATPAGEHEEANVVVAAQFAIDAPGGQQVPRYIFNQSSGGSLGDSFAEYLKAPDNMTEQQALISFLKWVYCNPKCNEADTGLSSWFSRLRGIRKTTARNSTFPQRNYGKLWMNVYPKTTSLALLVSTHVP